MASGDTKTEAMLNALGNGGSADEFRGCCNTKTQQYILDAIDRVQNVEDEVEELKNNPDVVDIVDTYADLQAYDTQHLSDNDIIRVLADETHSGNSTYYKFNKQAGTWTFIGEIAGGGGGVKELTSADYNYDDGNTGSFNTIGLWLLDDGIYKLPSSSQVSMKGGLSGSQIAAFNSELDSHVFHYLIRRNNYCWFLKDTSTTNANLRDYSPYYFCMLNKSDGYYNKATDEQNLVYSKITQSTGNATDYVMSQNAVTSMVFADPATKTKIKIGGSQSSAGSNSIVVGASSSAAGNESIAVGYNASANGVDGIAIGEQSGAYNQKAVAIGLQSVARSNSGVALGENAKVAASSNGAVAIGAYASSTHPGEMNIGSTNTSYGYNSSNYRLLSGVHDGQGIHDAATVAQGNTLATSAPTTSTVGVLGQLYTDTTGMHTYQCTAISGDTYTWTQRW